MWWQGWIKLFIYGPPNYGLMYKKKYLGQKVEIKDDIEGTEEVKEEEIPRERNKEEGFGETGEIASPSP